MNGCEECQVVMSYGVMPRHNHVDENGECCHAVPEQCAH